ncbi:MAG TPA: two-component regulator propeller domain-containing protein, partial [Saprospiraceae bacterium]|nr:two-component regulator propeller domain-containing protein [Saprospiraceae bacterium]
MHTTFPELVIRIALSIVVFVFTQDNSSFFAQISNFNFEYLTTEQGLSSNKVQDIIQDRDGFYWIATQNGLNRFDGTSFKIYRHETANNTSLTHNSCIVLAEGKNGDIWVGTYKGVSRFIREKGRFQQIYLTHPVKNLEVTNRIACLVVDREGNVWIGTNGLWKYDTKIDSLISILPDPLESSFISDYGLISHMVYDPAHHGVWFSTSHQLVYFDIPADQFYTIENNPRNWKVFAHADAAELTMDPKNQLWFLAKGSQKLCSFDIDQNSIVVTEKQITSGLHKIYADVKSRIWLGYWSVPTEIYDPAIGGIDTSFFVTHHPGSLINNKLTALFVDQQQNYWIGSWEGISIYHEANQYYKKHQMKMSFPIEEEAQLSITAIAQNKPDFIWLGTSHGLFKYHLTSGISKRIPLDTPHSVITSLYADSNWLWIGSYDRLLCLDIAREAVVKTMQLNPRISFIRKGVKNDLWAAQWNDGLYHINLTTNEIMHFQNDSSGSTSLKSNHLVSGFVDNGSLWIGYNGGVGYSKFDLEVNRIGHFDPLQVDSTSLFAGTITAITKDDLSNIWFGTYGSGVFRYDVDEGSYKLYQQGDGLNSHFINSIIPDRNGNIWISTADGLNYFNSHQGTMSKVDIHLVFPSNDFIANGIQGIDGNIYFFCMNEFVEIRPESYLPEQQPPHIVISGFRIFDKEIVYTPDDTRINLSHWENFFSFEYSLLRTNPRKEVKYAHILSGFDESWNIGTKNFASYTNVPGGHYQFMVKATDSDGQWSDVLLTIPIRVRPPFWRTWWFIALCSIVAIGGIVVLYLYNIRQIRRVYNIKAKISQDLHDDVGSSLSSIHIYSSVVERALNSDPEKARNIVQQIKQNSRQVMENMGDIIWSINTEGHHRESIADRIRNYSTDLLSQKNIACSYNIDQQVDRKL